MERKFGEGEARVNGFGFPVRGGVAGMVGRWLGVEAAENYGRTLPVAEGLRACVKRVLEDSGIEVGRVEAAARGIPQRGALLVTANHPTGILDGVVLLAALLSRRDDVRVVANEMLGGLPLLGERVIPINKAGGRSGGGFLAMRGAWRRGECVVSFPAGTVAHWQWREWRVAEAPWSGAIQRLAARVKVPEMRAVLAVKNPAWFHACAAVSRQARTALLLRAFLARGGTWPVDAVKFLAVG